MACFVEDDRTLFIHSFFIVVTQVIFFPYFGVKSM